MRKQFVLIFFTFMAFLPQTAPCQNKDLQSFLSGQKEKYFTKGHPKAKGINISIEYPSHWQRSEGERPNIVQKFSGDASDGITRMCIILIIDLPELLKFFSSEDFLDTIFLPDTLKEMLPSGARFLKGDKTKYDGEPGAWMIYVIQEERSGLKFVMYVLQHVFLYSGKLVMIQCGVGGLASTSRTIEQIFYEYLPLFYQMGNSIIIHDKWERGATNYGNDASSVINMDSSNSGMVYHRDEANGFAIWYPRTWAKVPATYAAIKFKVVSKSGLGGDDFNVVVISDPAFQNITGERMVEMWQERPEAILAQLRKSYPDAKIIKSGKTSLDNKPAYYVIFDGTFRSFDLEVPMRFLQVFAVYNGRAYYLTSRTGPDEFDDMKPIFTFIMGGFKFLQQGATDYKSNTSSVVSKGGLWLGPAEILLTLIVPFILIGIPIIIFIRKYKSVRGWLLFFCIILTVLSPLFTISNLFVNYYEASPYLDRFPGLLTVSIVDIILTIGLIGFSIYTGIALWSIRPGAVKTAKIYLLVYMGYIILKSFLLFTTNKNMPEEPAALVIVGFIYFAIWYLYLIKSKRVKATYGTVEDRKRIEKESILQVEQVVKEQDIDPTRKVEQGLTAHEQTVKGRDIEHSSHVVEKSQIAQQQTIQRKNIEKNLVVETAQIDQTQQVQEAKIQKDLIVETARLTQKQSVLEREIEKRLLADKAKIAQEQTVKNHEIEITLPEQAKEQPIKILSIASSYSEQPEENIITISRIEDASCPHKYYKNYIESPQTKPEFESIELGLGSFFHSYMENYFKTILNHGTFIQPSHRIDIPDLISSFRMSFIWEGKLREPYRIVQSNQQIEDFIERLRTVGENFNIFLARTLSEHRIIDTEGQLEIRTTHAYIRGKYDLITQTPDGEIFLWDWKTGKMPEPRYYDDFKNKKVQLGIYAIWLRHKYNREYVKATALFLRDGVDTLSEVFNSTIEDDVLNYVYQWRERLNNFTSYPPTPNNLCDWCRWKPVCPAFHK